MTEPGLLQDVLQRYRFRHEISERTQLYLIHSKRRVLKAILKKSEAYGFLFGLVMIIYFFIRKKGLLVSVKACTVIISVTLTTILAASFFFGGILLKPVITDLLFPENQQVESPGTTPEVRTIDDKTETIKQLPKTPSNRTTTEIKSNGDTKITPVSIQNENEQQKIDAEKEAARLKKEKDEVEEKRKASVVSNIPNL